MFIDTHNELVNLPAVDPTGESNTSRGMTTYDRSAKAVGLETFRADKGPGRN